MQQRALFFLAISSLFCSATAQVVPDVELTRQEFCKEVLFCWKDMRVDTEEGFCDREGNPAACGNCYALADNEVSIGCFDQLADGSCPAGTAFVDCSKSGDDVDRIPKTNQNWTLKIELKL